MPVSDKNADNASSDIVIATDKKTRRPRLPASLPRQEVLHDLPEEEKTCLCCGHVLHKIGEACSEQLAFIPAQIKVIRHIRPQYGCWQCEQQGTDVSIRVAPVPPTILPKSFATPSLLAQIISSKFQFSLPLYRIEQAIKGECAGVKVARRQQEAKPLLAEFKAWLDKSAPQVPPESLLGKALHYSLNQWPKLERYLEHGELSIDNNRAERAIKPFVIGRKNWMLANTRSGARASAVLYSLVETAKANGLIAFDYLMHLFTELPKLAPDRELDQLLPWNVTLAGSKTAE